MSVSEWAAVVAAGAAVIFVVAAIWIAVVLRRTLDDVRKAVVDVRPLVSDARRTLQTANNAAEKTDALLSTATSVTGTVDSASKLAYNVFSNPVIKAAALASGIGRGVHVLRQRAGMR